MPVRDARGMSVLDTIALPLYQTAANGAAGMAQPLTLLQMAGARLAPGRFDDSAVVIIDAQKEYVTGRLPLPGVEAALGRIAALLAAARAAGATIVHVAHRGEAGGVFDPATDAFQFAPGAEPRDGEAVVEKPLPNAFAATDLDARLKAAGHTSVILAGFMTHMCISSTARAALDLGYRTTVLADATATRPLPGVLDGAAVAAPDLHNAALAELADLFAAVVRTADIV